MRTDDTMKTRRLCRRLIKLVKMVIYNSFIVSNISYCPLARHLCSASSKIRLEKVRERT